MGRFHRQAQQQVQSAQEQLHDTTDPRAAWRGLNNGNYHAAMTDSLVIKLIRVFGLNNSG